MRIGALLMPTDPWPETKAKAQELEAAGFDHLWVYDHINWRRYRHRPWFGAVPWLTGVAAATSTIRLGTLVANPNIRHPLTFAKDVITLDHISGGRVTLGIGAGGTGHDASIMGHEPLSPGRRVDRLQEFLTMLDGLLCGTIESARGGFYSVTDAQIHPKCLQEPRVPFAIAAGGPRTISLAARFGEAWITWGDTSGRDLTPDGTIAAVQRQLELLARACDAADRRMDDLDRIFLIGNTEDRPLVSAEAFLDFARTYAAMGFTDLVFHHPRVDDEIWNEDPSVVDDIAGLIPELHRL